MDDIPHELSHQNDTTEPDGTTDYDAWVSDPDNLALHIAGIVRHLTRRTADEAREASIRRRWPYLVDPDTGHLNGYELCWICASGLVHTGRFLPRFRACRWCLVHDRRRAARLGLRHLLPVFDWPVPPVIDSDIADRLDDSAREAVITAWTSVSVLDRWRRESVRLSYAYMDVPEGEAVDLYDWQERLTVGAERSRACWEAYVGGHHPELRHAVRRKGATGLVQR